MIKQRTVDAARGRWVGILTSLGVDESFLRNKHGPCPVCGGTDRFRFDDKDGNGTWFCSKCGSGRGIELVIALRGGITFKEACAVIDPLVGSAKMHTSRDKKRDPAPLIMRIKSESSRDVADVAQYLEGRGLEVPPGILGHAGLTYYTDGNAAGKYAAMIAPMLSHDGELLSHHVTYLEDGKKAQVDPAKKMMTPVRKLDGACARLYRRGQVLAIAEGIESAIAYKMLTSVPTWAATSSSLLAKWKPPLGVSTVVIAGDNDASYAGQHAAYSLACRLVIDGYHVMVDIPKEVDTDWCDVLENSRKAQQ